MTGFQVAQDSTAGPEESNQGRLAPARSGGFQTPAVTTATLKQPTAASSSHPWKSWSSPASGLGVLLKFVAQEKAAPGCLSLPPPSPPCRVRGQSWG